MTSFQIDLAVNFRFLLFAPFSARVLKVERFRSHFKLPVGNPHSCSLVNTERSVARVDGSAANPFSAYLSSLLSNQYKTLGM